MHISTNDLHYCKPARLLQQAPSGGRPHLVCPSHTSERGGEGDCVREGGGGEGKCERERALEWLRYYIPGH
jgi:hypothetical protein